MVKQAKATSKAVKASSPAASSSSSSSSSSDVIIEACKSWGVFKNRAEKLSALLKVEGYTISINPEKPRKGCFVVSVGSTKHIELLNMPRPFLKLKALDFEKVAQDIINAKK